MRVLYWLAMGAASLALEANGPVARAEEFDPSKLSGTVTDIAGTPMAGADVWMNRWGGTLDPAQVAAREWKVTTDRNRKYELKLRCMKGQQFIVNELFAEAAGYVRAWSEDEISLQGGKNATVDFHLEKGEVIAGVMRLPLMPREIAGKSKEAIDDLSMQTFMVDGPNVNGMPPNARLHQTDKDGKFEFYFPRGEYTLSVPWDGEGPREWKGIRSGQRGLELKVPPFEWTPDNVGKAFDDLWNVMDRNYSYFFLKKDVDWKALHDQYRPAAVKAKNAAELAAVLKDMLAPLDDMHVWIQTPTGIVGTSKRGGYAYNGNHDVTMSQLVDSVECGKFAVVGKTKTDGFGYFLMLRQGAATKADVRTAVDAIQKLRDASGFVVDLRSANGGNELLAQDIARQFCAKETVYAKSKYRHGPGHDQFGQVYDRLLPATPGAYTKPVVCLIGPGAVSSGEGFVQMMKCLPNVTTVGMPTRGASGNPNGTPLARSGLMVYYSRWVDLLPDGKTFEGVGIPPDIRVDRPTAAYAAADPTLEKGLEVLRSKLAANR
jgi:carboxyl-terminal processing protease